MLFDKKNADRKFGAAEHCYPAWIKDLAGKEYFALFTQGGTRCSKTKRNKKHRRCDPVQTPIQAITR